MADLLLVIIYFAWLVCALYVFALRLVGFGYGVCQRLDQIKARRDARSLQRVWSRLKRDCQP